MIYRESGQFKTTYKADQAILPIFQDKVAMSLLMLFAFVVIPFIADDYWLSSNGYIELKDRSKDIFF